jgi:molybdopterin molybdotransferase
MPPLSLLDARAAVLRELGAPHRPGAEAAALDEALGRVLAADVPADRDQPPFPRVTRDGFAVRAADVAAATPEAPVPLAVIGELPPGSEFAGQVAGRQCVEIMTGAALPAGADAVVMVEHTERPAAGTVVIRRAVRAGENVVPRGSELAAGAVALPARHRLDPSSIGLLASLGCARPMVFARPRVAIVATGDELVAVEEAPRPMQIRNSNRHSLAAQVLRAGGTPRPARIARDERQALRAVIEEALLDADLLLLSGGVSMGKYDFVEDVLAQLGGTVVFDGVAIRPGKPLVFGRVRGVPFFGLPGNPLSTMVTFELFVRPALSLLAGADAAPLYFTQAPLAEDYAQRSVPLTVFVPARFDPSSGDTLGMPGVTAVRPVPSQGSGDLAAMARADCLIVLEPGATALGAGALVRLLPK